MAIRYQGAKLHNLQMTSRSLILVMPGSHLLSLLQTTTLDAGENVHFWRCLLSHLCKIAIGFGAAFALNPMFLQHVLRVACWLTSLGVTKVQSCLYSRRSIYHTLVKFVVCNVVLSVITEDLLVTIVVVVLAVAMSNQVTVYWIGNNNG